MNKTGSTQNEAMTLKEIEAIGKAYAHRSDADALHVGQLCAQAKETLELREALEWLAKHDAGIAVTPYGYRAWRWPRVSAEGKTALEAIQKARGKK